MQRPPIKLNRTHKLSILSQYENRLRYMRGMKHIIPQMMIKNMLPLEPASAPQPDPKGVNRIFQFEEIKNAKVQKFKFWNPKGGRGVQNESWAVFKEKQMEMRDLLFRRMQWRPQSQS